jgi:glycosyltransferase involved in cell wall biosynthesis
MNNINVAIDATIVKPQRTGLDRYAIEVLSQLATILDNNPNYNFEVFTHDKSIEKFWKRSISIVSGIDPSLKRYSSRRFFWHMNILPIILKMRGFDLLYSPCHEGIFIPSVKQIITIHDLLPVKYPEIYPKIKYYFKYMLPILIRASSAIITISEATKNDIISYYKVDHKPIYVIPHGINRNIFSPVDIPLIDNVKHKYNINNYILFVSETRPYKNLYKLVQAYSNLNIPDIDLVIVGNIFKYGKDELLGLIKTLEIEERVRFLGYVPDNDLPSLYSGARMLVFPSLVEGFGAPPLEAMSCGCPVIASNASSVPEVCGNAALYIDPYNIDDISDRIKLLISNDPLRQELIQKGIARSQLFSWEKTVSDILQVIEKVALS